MKRFAMVLCLLLVLALVCSCALRKNTNPEKTSETNYTVEEPEETGIKNVTQTPLQNNLNPPRVNAALYFYDKEHNELSPEVRSFTKTSDEYLMEDVVRSLINGPRSDVLHPVIHPETRLIKLDRAENILTVNLSAEFLKSGDLVIARAALTNSLVELGIVKYVKLYVDSNELTDNGKKDGKVLGLLTRYPRSIPEILAQESRAGSDDIRYIDRELFFRDKEGTFLLPEVRTINVTNKQYAQAIVEELLKGPVSLDQGMYPTLPEGTILNKTETVKDEDGKGIALYFSKELKTNFKGGTDAERALLGSLVYSLTTLPDTDFIKVYYETDPGVYTDLPIHSISLDQGLSIDDFPDFIGTRVKVYFGDPNSMLLIPEYRAVARNGGSKVDQIIEVLASSPISEGSVMIMPPYLKADNFTVRVVDSTAIINIPPAFYEHLSNSDILIRNLYAIVNSLTDPWNQTSIKQVRFVAGGIEGNTINTISLNDPFVMNAALIKDTK
ncbi:MAG TPA: GerMN domain-containing protein [Candidatus Atribacteria bacterium]|nr:GerMN domain-containing protein [Candidatus Atribacteria bacterium]